MYGLEMMIKIQKVEQYLQNELNVSFGLAISGNEQIIDIVFENITEKEAATIKDDLVKLFPDVINFS